MIKLWRISCKMMYIACTSQMTFESLGGRNHLPLCIDGGDDDGGLHFTGCRLTCEWVWTASYGFRYWVYLKVPLSSLFFFYRFTKAHSVNHQFTSDSDPDQQSSSEPSCITWGDTQPSGLVSKLTFQGVCKSSVFVVHANGFEGRVMAGDDGNKTLTKWRFRNVIINTELLISHCDSKTMMAVCTSHCSYGPHELEKKNLFFLCEVFEKLI